MRKAFDWRGGGRWTGVRLGSLVALSRLAMQPLLGHGSAYVMAAPAMIVAAFFGGAWPTVAVGALALAVGWFAGGGVGHGGGLGGLALYLGFTAVFATAGEMRRRGLRRAEADAAKLAEMQERLLKVARLNAMGEIAGALAHELNQPLTAIASYAGAAQLMIRGDSAAEAEGLLDKICEQSVRARDIIGRIRGHVAGEVDLRAESLADIVREAAPLGAAGAADVSIAYDLDPAADRVLADRVQTQQVIVNLVRNAVEAMPAGTPRRLRIVSRAADAGLTEVSVTDAGPGLAPALAERIFEPFVSGKPDGMGIGLAVCRSIVEAQGGRIWAENETAGGAAFRFTLPRAKAQPEARPRRVAEAQP